MKPREIGTLALCIVCLAAFMQSCSSQKEAISVTPKIEAPIATAPPAPATEPPYLSVDYQYPISLVYNPKVIVYKGKRKLSLVNDKVLIREYPISLGFNPQGDKRFQGDGRTPEGEYFICVKNVASKYYKSLGINYPDPRHAEEGLATGCISTDQYSKILDANQCRLLPPRSTPLGGDIYIHGGGTEHDWTLGCIALNNKDIDEIFEVVSIGTPVVILP